MNGPAVPPDPGDNADRTIRNQRYYGWSAAPLIAGWFGVWLAAVAILEGTTPRAWEKQVLIATAIPILVTLFILIRHLDLRPVERLRVGHGLRAYPSGRFQPADLVVIRFSPDAHEDYAEDNLPVPWCQVVVRGRRGRTIRLVASAGDAARLRQWAERNRVSVDDPHGLAARPTTPETRE